MEAKEFGFIIKITGGSVDLKMLTTLLGKFHVFSTLVKLCNSSYLCISVNNPAITPKDLHARLAESFSNICAYKEIIVVNAKDEEEEDEEEDEEDNDDETLCRVYFSNICEYISSFNLGKTSKLICSFTKNINLFIKQTVSNLICYADISGKYNIRRLLMYLPKLPFTFPMIVSKKQTDFPIIRFSNISPGNDKEYIDFIKENCHNLGAEAVLSKCVYNKKTGNTIIFTQLDKPDKLQEICQKLSYFTAFNKKLYARPEIPYEERKQIEKYEICIEDIDESTDDHTLYTELSKFGFVYELRLNTTNKQAYVRFLQRESCEKLLESEIYQAKYFCSKLIVTNFPYYYDTKKVSVFYNVDIKCVTQTTDLYPKFFVEFQTPDEVDDYLERSSLSTVEGYRLCAAPFEYVCPNTLTLFQKQRCERLGQTKSVMVKGVAKGSDISKQMREIIKECGIVTYVVMEEENEEYTLLIGLESPESAKKAIEHNFIKNPKNTPSELNTKASSSSQHFVWETDDEENDSPPPKPRGRGRRGRGGRGGRGRGGRGRGGRGRGRGGRGGQNDRRGGQNDRREPSKTAQAVKFDWD